jgi:hypothetical protein
VANDLVHHFETPIELLHQLAGSVDHLEDVHALLVVPNLVGEALAAPVLGFLDLAVHARHHAVELAVQVGHLLFGGVGRKNVDELVLTV